MNSWFHELFNVLYLSCSLKFCNNLILWLFENENQLIQYVWAIWEDFNCSMENVQNIFKLKTFIETITNSLKHEFVIKYCLLILWTGNSLMTMNTKSYNQNITYNVFMYFTSNLVKNEQMERGFKPIAFSVPKMYDDVP